MSISTLGHSENLDRYWSGSDLQLGEEVGLEISNVRSRFVESKENIENYPYKRQLVIEGDFEYEMPTYDDSEPYTPGGSFEYRSSSGLFLVDTDATRPNHEKVISAINEQVSSDAEIEDSLSISRRDLWNFLSKADSVNPLIIHGSEGRYNARDLLKVFRESDGDPIETLNKLHREGDVDNYQVLKEIIIDMNYNTLPSSLSELDIDLYKNRIVNAEADFRQGSSFVTITYDDGAITIDPMNDDVREYALQLIETHLIS